jgi:hypothetical protein
MTILLLGVPIPVAWCQCHLPELYGHEKDLLHFTLTGKAALHEQQLTHRQGIVKISVED